MHEITARVVYLVRFYYVQIKDGNMATDRVKQIRTQYEKDYDLSTLNNSNDQLNLDTLIRNTVLIEKIDAEIDKFMAGNDIAGAVVTIGKLASTKDGLQQQNVTIERQLGIDRKSRKKDNESSAAEYIIALKQNARDFLEKRLTKVFCPTCKILVMRFSAAYEHTEFDIAAQCPQCNKFVTAKRKERDVFFDLLPRDKNWRKRYPMEVILPKKQKTEEDTTYEDELIIDDGGE